MSAGRAVYVDIVESVQSGVRILRRRNIASPVQVATRVLAAIEGVFGQTANIASHKALCNRCEPVPSKTPGGRSGVRFPGARPIFSREWRKYDPHHSHPLFVELIVEWHHGRELYHRTRIFR